MKFKVKITQIDSSKYGVSAGELFDTAKRDNNNKRKFLFVNKVLGKHTPVKPSKIIKYGSLISRLHDSGGDNSKILVIGFAETATALGNIVFEDLARERIKLGRQEDIRFIHTTREEIEVDGNGNKLDYIEFREEHSHAVAHRVYINEKIMAGVTEVILVDDEITTGNTALNAIKAIYDRYNINNFSILTYLDWRNRNCIEKFYELEEDLRITVKVKSLISGSIISESPSKGTYREDIENSVYEKNSEYKDCVACEACNKPIKNYIEYTGRFGITGSDITNMDTVVDRITEYISKFKIGRTLVLGTEEFMYIPLKIAGKLDNNSLNEVMYQSTTRSPIQVDWRVIKSKNSFKSIYNKDITNYVYNIPNNYYDTIIVVLEYVENIEGMRELRNILQSRGAKIVEFINVSGITIQ